MLSAWETRLFLTHKILSIFSTIEASCRRDLGNCPSMTAVGATVGSVFARIMYIFLAASSASLLAANRLRSSHLKARQAFDFV